jgi:streptogramin lyase
MKRSTGKIPAICVALALTAASTLLAVGPFISSQAQSSLASGISSATDYAIPAGSDPWGTAFDSSGRVWVAIPGCDLAPSCPNTTPPGKLALFDPNAQNWATVVSLPVGYGQLLFVAVDHTGKVWFTMPVTNTIGMYDPVSTTATQWAVPTPSAGPWGIALDSKGTIWFTELSSLIKSYRFVFGKVSQSRAG